MGAYSTLDITREDALEAIRARLNRCNDDELAEAMFGLFGDRTLCNFTIVDKYDEESPNWNDAYKTLYVEDDVEQEN